MTDVHRLRWLWSASEQSATVQCIFFALGKLAPYLSHVSTLTRDIDIAILSVCPSRSYSMETA